MVGLTRLRLDAGYARPENGVAQPVLDELRRSPPSR
jgi:hypothetical protein